MVNFIFFIKLIKINIKFNKHTISQAQSCNLAGLSCKCRLSWIKHGVKCILHLYFSHKVAITSDFAFSSFNKSSSLIVRDFFFLDCNSISSSTKDNSPSSEL